MKHLPGTDDACDGCDACDSCGASFIVLISEKDVSGDYYKYMYQSTDLFFVTNKLQILCMT